MTAAEVKQLGALMLRSSLAVALLITTRGAVASVPPSPHELTQRAPVFESSGFLDDLAAQERPLDLEDAPAFVPRADVLASVARACAGEKLHLGVGIFSAAMQQERTLAKWRLHQGMRGGEAEKGVGNTTFHLYYYALANPLKYTDPTGHEYEPQQRELSKDALQAKFAQEEREAAQLHAEAREAASAIEPSADRSLMVVEGKKQPVKAEPSTHPDEPRFAARAGQLMEDLLRSWFGTDDPVHHERNRQSRIDVTMDRDARRELFSNPGAADARSLGGDYRSGQEVSGVVAHGGGKAAEFTVEQAKNYVEAQVGGKATDVGVGIVQKKAAPLLEKVLESKLAKKIEALADRIMYGDVIEETRRGARNPRTRASAAIGQEAHRQKEAEYADLGYDTEVPMTLEGGQRVRKDAVRGNETVIIKPDTPSGRRAGEKRADLMRESGYEPTVDLYDPTDPRWLPGSPTYIGPKP